MPTPNIAKFDDFSAADAYKKRLAAAYPKHKYEVMTHPAQHAPEGKTYHAVARMADNGFRVHSWVPRVRLELPGEVPEQWAYFLEAGPTSNKSGSFWAPKGMSRGGVMGIIKKQLGWRGLQGRVKWSESAAVFKPYGRKMTLTISKVSG